MVHELFRIEQVAEKNIVDSANGDSESDKFGGRQYHTRPGKSFDVCVQHRDEINRQ